MNVDDKVNAPKVVKFNDKEITELFKLLNDDIEISQFSSGYIKPYKMIPVFGNKSFRNFSAVLNRINGNKVNAYYCIDAGHVYENFPAGPMSPKERVEKIKIRAEIIINKINDLLKSPLKPQFNNLYAECVNKDFNYFIAKRDYGDDGDDKYGAELFIKIAYKQH